MKKESDLTITVRIVERATPEKTGKYEVTSTQAGKEPVVRPVMSTALLGHAIANAVSCFILDEAES